MHSHPDGVAIFQNDIHCRFTFPDGKTEEQRFRAGQTLYYARRKPFAGEPEQKALRRNTSRTETIVRETAKRILRGWWVGAWAFVSTQGLVLSVEDETQTDRPHSASVLNNPYLLACAYRTMEGLH